MDFEIGRLMDALKPRTCEGCAHWHQHRFRGRPLPEGNCGRILSVPEKPMSSVIAQDVGAFIEVIGGGNAGIVLVTHPSFSCRMWLDEAIPTEPKTVAVRQ